MTTRATYGLTLVDHVESCPVCHEEGVRWCAEYRSLSVASETADPDASGRCPECGGGWWEPHVKGCSEPRINPPESADPFGDTEPWTVDWKVTGPFRNWRGRTYWNWHLDEPRRGWLQMTPCRISAGGRAPTQQDAVARAQVAAFNLARFLNFPDAVDSISGSETGM